MKSKQRLLFTAAGFAMAASTMTTPAFAQEGAAERDHNIIIVTATKRETSLVDTSVTVSVVSGEDIANEGVIEVTQLFESVPGISFHQSPGDLPVPKIRGIGSDSANQTFEQSVGLFLDGVYKPRARQYRDALFDVQRVEVIRGAQGVVFGKNTSVGAVSITSRKPGDEFGGELAGSYETEFGSYQLSGAVDIPVGDAVKFRFAGQYGEQGGYVRNVALNQDDGDSERWVARGTMVVDPGDGWSATLMAQHSESNTTGNLFEFVTVFPGPLATLFNDNPFEKSVDGNRTFPDGNVFPAEGDEQESTDVALTLNYEVTDDLTLTSLSSYSEFTFANIFDVFTATLPPFVPLAGSQKFSENFEQFTQEVRFDYQGNGFSLLGGLFYQDQKFSFDNQTGVINIILPVGTVIPGLGDLGGFNLGGMNTSTLDQDVSSISGFLQASIDLSDRVRLDIGGRISNENKKATFSRVTDGFLGLAPIAIPADLALPVGSPARAGVTVAPIFSPNGSVSDQVKDTAIDGAITLSFDITDDWLIYASASQGTKSAGFNNAGASFVIRPDPFIVNREVARTGEVGLKGTFADGRGYLSATAFYTKVKDFQVSVFDENSGPAGQFVTRNIDATTFGLEVESRFSVTDQITLNGNFGLLDATNDATDGRLSVAPKFTGSLGIDFDGDLDENASLQLGASGNYNSGYLHRQTPVGANPANPANAPITSGSYFLASAYAGLTLTKTGIQLRFDIDNLTNERYRTFGFIHPVLSGGVVGTYNRPRTFRMSARVPF